MRGCVGMGAGTLHFSVLQSGSKGSYMASAMQFKRITPMVQLSNIGSSTTCPPTHAPQVSASEESELGGKWGRKALL